MHRAYLNCLRPLSWLCNSVPSRNKGMPGWQLSLHCIWYLGIACSVPSPFCWGMHWNQCIKFMKDFFAGMRVIGCTLSSYRKINTWEMLELHWISTLFWGGQRRSGGQGGRMGHDELDRQPVCVQTWICPLSYFPHEELASKVFVTGFIHYPLFPVWFLYQQCCLHSSFCTGFVAFQWCAWHLHTKSISITSELAVSSPSLRLTYGC